MRIAEVPRPEPGPGEVRVRLEGCEVCGSSLGPWEGLPWTAFPLAPGAPGHEGWGQAVAIVGLGFLGALLVRLAHHAGARVRALSRRAFARDAALRAGAERARPFDPDAFHAEVQESLDLATRLSAEGGRLIIAGDHQDGRRQVDMQLWNWRGLDVVNAHERDLGGVVAGMREALAAVLAGRIEPFPLLPHAERRPEGFLKGVVVV